MKRLPGYILAAAKDGIRQEDKRNERMKDAIWMGVAIAIGPATSLLKGKTQKRYGKITVLTWKRAQH